MLLEIISKNQLVDGVLLPFLPEAMELAKKSDPSPSFDEIISDLDGAYTRFLSAYGLESRFQSFVEYGFSYLQGLVHLVNSPDNAKLDSMDVRSTYFTDLFIMFNRFLGRSFNEQQVGLIGGMVANAMEQLATAKVSVSGESVDYAGLLGHFFTQLESK